jgi:hypothetical protein
MDRTAWFGPRGVFSSGEAAHIFGSKSVGGPVIGGVRGVCLIGGP